MLLLVTGLSPTWAEKLKLHVTDMQNHNVANVKLTLDYNENQTKTTDANGYITFDVSDDYFNYDRHISLSYTCDEPDADNRYDHDYRYSTQTDRLIRASEKNNVIEVVFEHDTFLNFDFTQHLTELQRNYLMGKSVTFAVSYNNGETSTRCFKYNGEKQKSFFFYADKSSYKVTCYVNSDYFGNYNTVIAELADGSVYLPSTIGVDLLKDRLPFTLNSLTGIDGQPVTQGRVGDYDLANGLPAVVCYVSENDNFVRLNCLLTNYQGFSFVCPRNGTSLDINLQGNGKTINATLKDHNGNAMAGAKVLTLKSNEQSYIYDSLLVTTSNAQGLATFNAVNYTSEIMPWELVIVPKSVGYPITKIDTQDDGSADNTNLVIDYSRSRFIDVRIKDFGTKAWKERFVSEAYYTVYYKDNDDRRNETRYVTFNEGNDLICRAIIDEGKNVGLHDLQLELHLRGYTSSEEEQVLPYTVKLATVPAGDLSYTIAPLDWKKVNINFNLGDEQDLMCNYFVIDDYSFQYHNYGDNYHNAVVMPAGEHALNARFEGDGVLYDYGTPQKFMVSNNDDTPQTTFTLNRNAYTGYEVSVTAPDGTPAERYSFSMDGEGNYNSNSLMLDASGKGRIYTAPTAGTLTYKIDTYNVNMKPYVWTADAVIGPKQKAIDLSHEYNKVDISIKMHASSSDNPYTIIYWAETADGINNKYDSDGNNKPYIYEMNVNGLQRVDDTNVFKQSVYLPNGWMSGYTIVNDAKCYMPSTQLNANTAYTFDFTTFSKVNYVYDNTNYGGKLVIVNTSNKEQMNEYSQLLAPGEYKACYIGFKENGDSYYIQAPTTTFTVMGDGADMTVNLVNAADDDYVDVPLSATGIDSDFGNITRANVSVTYDGLFELTERNNSGEFSFNKLRPWKMLKGSYDYKVGHLWFDNGAVVAYGINGHIDVKDNASVFNIDLSGVHQFSSTAFADVNGNSIDWEEHGLRVVSYKILDADGYGHNEIYYGSSYGLFIADGDYDVILTTYDNNYNAEEYKATLHVDAQSGKVATFRTTEITGIAEAAVNANALQAQFTNGKLLVMGSNASAIQVSVYTLSGVKLMSTTTQSNDTLDLSNLQRGTYVVRLQQGNSTKGIKIIK